MNVPKAWFIAALAFSSLRASADGFEQVHFGVYPETRVLAVKVLCDKPVWKLWPEQVKIEHTNGRIDFTFSYADISAPKAVLTDVTRDKAISESCQQEAKALLAAPKTMPSEKQRTTTVYLPLEEPHQDRLTLNSGEGMKVLDGQPMQSVTGVQSAISTGVDRFSKAVEVELEFFAGWSIDYGPSDISFVPMETAGRFRVIPARKGLAAVIDAHEQKVLSDGCFAEITKLYSAPEEDKTKPKDRKARKVKAVLTLDGVPAAEKLQFIGATGFQVKTLEVLE